MHQGKPPDLSASDNVIQIGSIGRRVQADPDYEPPLSHDERRRLRRLLALGPDAIERTVQAVDIVRVACPTMRRELSED